MSGNLTELVQHLCTLSRAHVGAARQALAKDQGGRSHGEALRHLWAGELRKVVDLTSALLAQEPEGERRFESYRLWIEALAERRETASLVALRDHLFLRGQADPSDHATYVALRGLVHLELDELGGARLLARAVADCSDNPYCLELSQRVASRTATAEIPDLCRATVPITDYCLWQSLARGLLAGRQEEALNEVLAFVRETFPGATLPHLFEYHRCIDASFYAGAALVAERLVELYPQNVDFLYYNAYALYEDGDYPSARKLLNETLRLSGDKDAEVIGLLGHCNAKLGGPEKASQYLQKAVSLLAAEGLPTSHISLELATVEEELRGDQPEVATALPQTPKRWMVKLSPRRNYELLTSSQSSIDRLIRPLGSAPKRGDVCVFATSPQTSTGGVEQWKIAAIYAVDSGPMWHPTHGFHSALKLVNRFTDSVPQIELNVREAPSTDRSRAPVTSDFVKYGVYELDEEVFDRIVEAAQMNREEMIERRLGGGQSRRPTA